MKKLFIALAVSAAVLFASFLFINALSGGMETQRAAERFGGDSAQFSLFLPAASKLNSLSMPVYEKAVKNSMLNSGVEKSWIYCYSDGGYLYVGGDKGSYTLKATGIGGDFFFFHPMKLRYGGYISGSDLMNDRVVLNEIAAWRLFGSVDAVGRTVDIGGLPLIVSGVAESDAGCFNKKARADTAMIFVSNERFFGTINCFEAVLPNGADGLAESTIKDSLPCDKGRLVTNSERYSVKGLYKTLLSYEERVIQEGGYDLPYWENAARMSEDRAALYLGLAGLAGFIITVCVLILIVRLRIWLGGRWRAKHEKKDNQ